MRIKAVLPIIFVLLLAACSEGNSLDNQQTVPLSLAAVREPVVTRTAQNIQGKSFDAGELINAYITVTGAADGTTTLGNPILLRTAAADANGINVLSANTGETLYYPPGNDVKISINAFYPSSVMSSFTSFSVGNPQISDATYKASDLMFAKTLEPHPKDNQTVYLQFQHKMAKLIVNASGDDFVTMKSIKVKTLYTTIGFDASTGDVDKTGLANKEDIIIAESDSYVSSLSGVALFPPQTKDDTYFIEVEAKLKDGTEDIAYYRVVTKEFESGKEYIVNLTIGPKNLTPDGIVLIDSWPATVGTIGIAPVGSLGLTITKLEDDNDPTTNTMKSDGTYDYTGIACMPVPTVTDGKTNLDGTPSDDAVTLVYGTDYEVEHYNNVNAGTALIVIRGKGAYDGLTTFKTFTINQVESQMYYRYASVDVPLSQNAIIDNPIVDKGNGHFTYTSSNSAVAVTDDDGNVYMKSKGTTTITASMDNSGNFFAKTITYNLKITVGDASKVMTVLLTNGDDYVYTGAAIEPPFTVIDNNSTLTSPDDYTYVYSTNVNVGQGTITITGHGNYEGTKIAYFNITKATNVFTTLNRPNVPIDCGDSKVIPRGSAADSPTLSLAAETFAIGAVPKFGAGSLTYSSSNTSIATVNSSTGVITGKGVGTATITASVPGTDNYSALSEAITVKVEKMTNIFVYNGDTEHVENGSSPTGSNSSSWTYWAQVRNGSPQTCNLTFAANARVYAVLVGAAGGNDTGTGRGGIGGLVAASKDFNKNASVTYYVWCGGGGYSDTQGSTTDAIRSLGGWPGGGRPGITGCSGAGGGVTAICTTNSTADWTFSSGDSRLLVAGAGGGSSNDGNGGESGNEVNESTEKFVGTMIKSTGSRPKWCGGNVNVAGEASGTGDPTADGGGGGAGYYGGLSGLETNSGTTEATGGHGGSNYINTAGGWTQIFSGLSGAHTWTEMGITVSENGHPQTTTDVAERQKCYPGYVIIKYKYNY